jgi:hypothetical protein
MPTLPRRPAKATPAPTQPKDTSQNAFFRRKTDRKTRVLLTATNQSLLQENTTLRARVADMMRIQDHRLAEATAKPARKVKAHR